MTYQFRYLIYSLPLFKNNLNEKTSFFQETAQKREILEALQKLFIDLQFIDKKALSIDELTKAFHWQSNEEHIQQDIQELSRIFFDIIDRGLDKTEYSKLYRNLYFGSLCKEIKCSKCGFISSREEIFCDLPLVVKGLKNIEESLDNFFSNEGFTGANQYFCSNCQIKVDAEQKNTISHLPPILTFSLKRFEIDMKTF